jgi:hypothetical protein
MQNRLRGHLADGSYSGFSEADALTVLRMLSTLSNRAAHGSPGATSGSDASASGKVESGADAANRRAKHVAKRQYWFRSTCQTWEVERDGSGSPRANFSIIVPHFQNCLVLSPTAIAQLDAPTSEAYVRLLVNYMFTSRMYVKKFVNVNQMVAAAN